MPTCKPLSTIGSTSSTFFLRGSEQPSATIASTAMLAARVHTSGEAQAPLEKSSSCGIEVPGWTYVRIYAIRG